MTFQPVIPVSGYAGWRFLQRTMETQKEAFVQSAPVKRAADNFREKIGGIRTPADLMANRRLLEVALGAFGLDEDINNTFFIRKILEEGTTKPEALANRLSDNRYAAFADAFGFAAAGPPRTVQPTFPDEILKRYEARQFERAVGAQNDTMRLALNLGPALDDLTRDTKSERAQWFAMMGNTPLRKVFEGALGLPKGIGSLDIDRQLDVFRSRAKSTFGTDKLADFKDPAAQEKLIRLFMIRTEAGASAGVSGTAIALSLLRAG